MRGVPALGPCGARAARLRGRRLRAAAALLVPGAIAGLFSGCGTSFKLPTENRTNRIIPTDKSYQMLATWTGLSGIADILLTQGTGSQLFLLFNHGGSGVTPRGEVRAYPLTRPVPIAGIDFRTLFNPGALCAGGNRVFVLDLGDTCLARANPVTGMCNDTTAGWNQRISNLGLYWRVREYGLLGGDTISTFTDTTMAGVHGVAADAQGRVYVSGLAIILVSDPADPRIRARTFQWRIYRYLRGTRYPGVVPADRDMPGADWHRDSTWVVEEGSGIGTVVGPRGLYWSAAGGNALFAADSGKGWVQKLDDQASSAGFYQLDGAQTGVGFNGPTDVTADLQGYVYVCDTGNRRVLRYGPDASYVQRVDVEPDAGGQPLQYPVAMAADDSVVYVADRGAAEVIRYQRRP